MHKENKNTRTPRLRFPEFREAGDWNYENGDKLFNQISNKNHNSDLPILAISQEHGAVPRNEIDYSVIVTDKSVESYKVVEVGDFIISLRSFQGGIEYSNYTGICSPAYLILRKINDVEDHFFRYYFKTDLFIQSLNKNLEGIRDGKMVSYKQFSELLLPTPSKPEQQKIAALLTSLDDLISAQTEKIKALQAHKKGLMQQMFPAEGERAPRVRFREFDGDGDWELKTFSQLLKIGNGQDYKHLSKGSIPVYGSGGYMLSVDRYMYEGESVCIGRKGTINKPMFLNGKFWVVDTLFYTHSFKDCLPKFIYLIFQNINWLDHNEAGGIPSLSKTNIEKIEVFIPKQNEQQKIAALLTSLDDLIAAQREKLDALKSHKKGLMQGIFPDPNNETI